MAQRFTRPVIATVISTIVGSDKVFVEMPHERIIHRLKRSQMSRWLNSNAICIRTFVKMVQ